jgi:hypothetical protein
VEGGSASALPPRSSWAPLLQDGLHVVSAAGGLCPLAWQEGVGYHLSHVRLHGLQPPMTFMLTTAGLWQQSVLQHRGAVTCCWCDGRGGYPPSLGGVYVELTPSSDCPALCGGFRLGDLPSAIQGLATVCVDPGGGSTFSPLKRATWSWNIHGLWPAFACQKEASRLWLCNNGQCIA